MTEWARTEMQGIARDMWSVIERFRLGSRFTEPELMRLLEASEGEPVALAELQAAHAKLCRIVEERRAPS
jgi:hypothetical protein